MPENALQRKAMCDYNHSIMQARIFDQPRAASDLQSAQDAPKKYLERRRREIKLILKERGKAVKYQHTGSYSFLE